MLKSIRLLQVSTLALVTWLISTNAWSEPPIQGPAKRNAELVLGVFPYLAPRELESIYAPIAAEFGHTLDRRVFFSTSSTFARFREKLHEEVFDVVFVQPFFYTEIADRYGYQPLAVRAEKLPAILVVGENSSIEQLQQLKGKTIALPPRSAAISYLVKHYIKQQGLKPGVDIFLKHHRSHATCMQQVLVDQAQACGTAPPALRFFVEKMNANLRVVERTPGIPNSLFAVHPRVPDHIKQKLIENITSWKNTPRGRAFLKSVKVHDFRPAEDSEYDVVRQLARIFK